MIYSYLRVSSDRQDVAAQRGAVEEYSKANNLPVDIWREIEISSRKSMEDRGIEELIRELKAGDILIVSEISRLARSVGEISIICDRLLKRNVRLISIKERIDLIRKGRDMDIQTLTMVTMFSLFAQMERAIISQRTREGLAATKAKGTKLGCPAPQNGAREVKRKADEFAESLRDEFTEDMAGMTQAEKAVHLNSRGVKSRMGGKWSVRSVQRVQDRLEAVQCQNVASM